MSCGPGHPICPEHFTCGLDGPHINTCIPKKITNFRPGISKSYLPRCMAEAISRSAKGQQTPLDDSIMGKLGAPINTADLAKCGIKIPYCQQAGYMDTIYCACQNINTPHATCMFAPCQSNTLAYKTTYQQKAMNDPSKYCPNEIICNSITSVGGNHNVVHTYQKSNCGEGAAGSTSTSEKLNSDNILSQNTKDTWTKYYWVLYIVIAFILVVIAGLFIHYAITPTTILK